jgi:hypothetical protein
VNSFFEELGERFVRAAARRGAAIEAPELSPMVAQELLELARVAAHTHERRFAPLTTYVAGLVAERVRTTGGTEAPEAVVEIIREVRRELESRQTASGEP